MAIQLFNLLLEVSVHVTNLLLQRGAQLNHQFIEGIHSCQDTLTEILHFGLLLCLPQFPLLVLALERLLNTLLVLFHGGSHVHPLHEHLGLEGGVQFLHGLVHELDLLHHPNLQFEEFILELLDEGAQLELGGLDLSVHIRPQGLLQSNHVLLLNVQLLLQFVVEVLEGLLLPKFQIEHFDLDEGMQFVGGLLEVAFEALQSRVDLRGQLVLEEIDGRAHLESEFVSQVGILLNQLEEFVSL